jgi:hypothetical protein
MSKPRLSEMTPRELKKVLYRAEGLASKCKQYAKDMKRDPARRDGLAVDLDSALFIRRALLHYARFVERQLPAEPTVLCSEVNHVDSRRPDF